MIKLENCYFDPRQIQSIEDWVYDGEENKGSMLHFRNNHSIQVAEKKEVIHELILKAIESFQ